MIEVSIGIPVYNEGKHITNTIFSALLQADEIIISDNASNDETEQICLSFVKIYKHIKYFRHKQNLGASFNFEFCLFNSSGKYFMWLGGHDMIMPNHINLLKTILEKDNKVSLAYSNTIFLYHNYSYANCKSEQKQLFSSDDLCDRIDNIVTNRKNPFVFHGLFRRETGLKFWYDYEIFKNIFTDSLFVTKLAVEGKIVLSPPPTYIALSPKEESVNDYTSLCSKMTRACTGLDCTISINPLSYTLAALVGQFLLLKRLKLSNLLSDEGTKRIIVKMIDNEKELLINIADKYFCKKYLYFKHEHESDIDLIISKLREKKRYLLKRKKLDNLVVIIKKYIKLFIPFGILNLYYHRDKFLQN